MNFPPLELIQLSQRDLVGPGVEFFFHSVSDSAALDVVQVFFEPEITSPEKLYYGCITVQGQPGAAQTSRNAMWFLSNLGAAAILIWGESHNVSSLSPAGERYNFNSPWMMVPGGKRHIIQCDFSSGAAANGVSAVWWGYSIPKGNVLSF